MAHRKIREFDGKNLLASQLNLDYKAILITPKTDLATLPQLHLWLSTQHLVAKPDQLFGKRTQYNLVLVNTNWDQTKQWLTEHQNKQITIGNATDTLTHFLIEPFIPHQEEYYINITSNRTHNLIQFSTQGGFNIEDRWDSVKTITIPTLRHLTTEQITSLIQECIQEHKTILTSFIHSLYTAYLNLNFTSIEINPFTIDNHHNNTNFNNIHLLDCVAQI